MIKPQTKASGRLPVPLASITLVQSPEREASPILSSQRRTDSWKVCDAFSLAVS